MARKPKEFIEEAAPVEQPAQPTAEPKPSFAAALASLAAVDAEPAVSKSDQQAKAARRAKAAALVASLQQGLPVLHIGADQMAKTARKSSFDQVLERIRYRARSDRDLAVLLTAYDKKTAF